MNSAQPSPTASGRSGAGAIRISASSKPRFSSSPANDSSTTKTIRWPRSRSGSVIATRLFVGPQAPGSGKTAIVAMAARG